MKVDFNLPNLTGRTADEKIDELYRFLYEHIHELNWAFNNLTTSAEDEQQYKKEMK